MQNHSGEKIDELIKIKYFEAKRFQLWWVRLTTREKEQLIDSSDAIASKIIKWTIFENKTTLLVLSPSCYWSQQNLFLK